MAEFKLFGMTSLSLAVGEKHEVEVEGLDGAKVLLVNAAGTIQAIGPKCTHYGAPLVKGVLTANGRITCPWHGACFNAKSGDVEDAPALDYLPTFKVIEREGEVFITGDKDAIQSGRRKPTIRRVATQTPADSDKVVIVGGGSGAVGAVEALREKGFPGSITVVSAEGYLPIDRPKLSKALLPDAAKLQLRDQSWYDAGSITVTYDEVTSVDFAKKTVTTKKGLGIPYTKLILATGGTPRSLPLEGFQTLGNIFTLRTVHDVKKIVGALGDEKKKVVVIGSSFIGLEVANALVKNHAVTVVGPSKVPLENVLGTQVGVAIQSGLEKSGVVFHLSSAIDKAEPAKDTSRVGFVLLKDGTRLEADVVVQGVGMKPATDFLKENSAVSLQSDGSLQTDESFAVTGLSDVYAVGDIATFPFHGPAAGGRLVRIEHWNVAQKAGRIVGESIARPAVRKAKEASGASSFFTPVFWSALSAQLRYCGNTAASGWNDVVIQGSLNEGSWAAFYTKDETVVAVATMGKDPVMVQSAELINVGKMPSKSLLAAGLDVLSLGPP